MPNLYLIGGVALVILALAGAVGWYAWDADVERARAEAAEVETKRVTGLLDEAVRINKQNLEVIADMEKRQAVADKIAADLQGELDVSAGSQLALAQALADLKRNPDVQKFLDTCLPADVLRLYGNAEAGSCDRGEADRAQGAGQP